MREGVEALDGLCEKIESAGRIGRPDRLCTFMGGIMHLVETKRPKGGRLEPWQERDHERRWLLGVRVHVLWTIEAVDEYLASVRVILNRGRK